MKLEALAYETHAGLRLSHRMPEIPHFVEIVTSEFMAASAICPVFLTKNADTGAFYAGALFGFKPGENVVAAGAAGPPPFFPLDRQRAGFFVSGDHIAIDLDDPRLTSDDGMGEPLFESDGQPAPALRQVQRQLTALVAGKRETDSFLAELLKLKLIEPIDVSLRFDDGEQLTLQGLYTISLDKLADLADEGVLRLFRNGFLQLAYAVNASLKQVGILADKRNRLLAAR